MEWEGLTFIAQCFSNVSYKNLLKNLIKIPVLGLHTSEIMRISRGGVWVLSSTRTHVIPTGRSTWFSPGLRIRINQGFLRTAGARALPEDLLWSVCVGLRAAARVSKLHRSFSCSQG